MSDEIVKTTTLGEVWKPPKNNWRVLCFGAWVDRKYGIVIELPAKLNWWQRFWLRVFFGFKFERLDARDE